MKIEQTLFIIPARGGSKGLPGKNIKPLNGIPLIHYSIQYARHFCTDAHICVSTDDQQIIETVQQTGLQVPFVRPANLASDTAGTYEVLLHALAHYEKQGIKYEKIVLLQPTSPFRLKRHLEEALSLYNAELEMIVSVKESKVNPYFNLFEEDSEGFIHKSKAGNFTRRQDCPKIYEFNGSLYIINTQVLKEKKIHEFSKVVKYVMEPEYSVDIDTLEDWEAAERKLKEGFKGKD